MSVLTTHYGEVAIRKALLTHSRNNKCQRLAEEREIDEK